MVLIGRSFTIYMTMVIVPYTRRSWRVKGALFFIITAWWVQSWAWYSITGLLLADMAANMNFKTKAQRGIKVWRSIRCPSYVVYAGILAAGLIMQYIWAAWRPEYRNEELVAHGGLYYTGGLNEDFDVKQPQARDDNYLVLLGFMLCVESSDIVQWALANPLLIYLGRRSLSKCRYTIQTEWTKLTRSTGWFLVQSILVYTLGIKLFQMLPIENSIAAVAVCFFVVLLNTALGSEIFYRVVEVPSHVLSHIAFDWIRE